MPLNKEPKPNQTLKPYKLFLNTKSKTKKTDFGMK